jgi:hypothetical protein
VLRFDFCSSDIKEQANQTGIHQGLKLETHVCFYAEIKEYIKNVSNENNNFEFEG